MSDEAEGFRKKVGDIFTELVGAENASWLAPGVPSRTMLLIANAVSTESGYSEKVGWDIGINVSAWQADAAFLVARHLFPERFTFQEIDDGVRPLLLHVPAHVNAAARLAGHSTEVSFWNSRSAENQPASTGLNRPVMLDFIGSKGAGI